MKKLNRINEEVIRKIYNKIAKAYESHRIYDPNQWDLVEFPQIQKINDDLNDKTILDAGCGTGIFIKEIMKKYSPKEIIGMDISDEMLRIAQKRCKKIPKVTLMQGNILETGFKTAYFDIIYSFGVLHYIEELDAVMKEFYRILKSSGKVLFSIRHPVRNLSYLAKDNNANYFMHGWHKERWPGTNKDDIYMFYRPLEEYVNTIVENGFCLTKLCESKPENHVKITYPDFYDKYTRIPRELLFILKKI